MSYSQEPLNDETMSVTSSNYMGEQDFYDDSICSNNHLKKHNPFQLDTDCRIFIKKYKKYKKYKIVYYATNMTPGSTIRDAITGMYFRNHLVGNNIEDLYFKVSFTQGKIPNISNNGEFLFYNNPTEYEKHMKVKLLDSIKNDWKIRNNNIFAQLR
jgi:hypothetical protein